MDRDVSALERSRVLYRPTLPDVLSRPLQDVGIEEIDGSAAYEAVIRERFPRTSGGGVLRLARGAAPEDPVPLRVGVVLSGGQAPGGHNVITGLHDALEGLHGGSKLFGFLGGPKGILTGNRRELTSEVLEPYRNTGGFDVIGSGRDKIETPEQMEACLTTCGELSLDGLVVIGGDDSNTNAAVLAEYFAERGCATRVVGVPKTIDGDLKGERVEASFGFDTATKIYSELVGNICRDALSAGKYWHFVKLMGRSASHVTLECALSVRPNVALIGEEIREQGATLDQIAERIAEVVSARAGSGKRHGVCLVPEGLIEFVPEVRALIGELNGLLADRGAQLAKIPGLEAQVAFLSRHLSEPCARTLAGFPSRIQEQLLLDRDSHGNVQVSKIETELLLTKKVERCLDRRASKGTYSGKFQVQTHFFGYEGRSAAPSNFDADYTYALGHVAAILIARGRTGCICSLRNLDAPPERWTAEAVPLTSMMQIETRKGKDVPVIAKALVRTDREPFLSFAASRDVWATDDHYLYPGALQYFGPHEISGATTRTLQLERRHG